jgi:hypothetical protein
LFLSLCTLVSLAISRSQVDASAGRAKITVIKDAERRKLIESVQLGDQNLDPEQAVAWAEDGSFQIGANPAVKGRAAIKGFLSGFFGMKLFTKIEHRFVEVVDLRDKLIYNAIVTYTLPGGGVLELPYVNWITFKREGKQLTFDTYRVFIDAAPLMARSKSLPQ